MTDRHITARVRRTEDGLIHEYEVEGAVINLLDDLPVQSSTNGGQSR
jgi:hypothetical protein